MGNNSLLKDLSKPKELTMQEKEDLMRDTIPAFSDSNLEENLENLVTLALSGTVVHDKTELEHTIELLEEARAGRKENEIPLADAYWERLKEHRVAYHNSKEY